MSKLWQRFLLVVPLFLLIFLGSSRLAQAELCPTPPESADCFPTADVERLGVDLNSPPPFMRYVQCSFGHLSGNDTTCAVYASLGPDLPPLTPNACDPALMNGLACREYSTFQTPGPAARGYTRCSSGSQLYGCCDKYITGAGYCVTIDEWVAVQPNCCTATQTACSTTAVPSGICTNAASAGADACDSGKICAPIPTNVDTSDPGTFWCNCTNNGANWYCVPGATSASVPNLGGGTADICPAWSAPDTGRCSTTLPSNQTPSFCDRVDGGRCSGELPCISQVTSPTNPLKGHGETCDNTAATDQCNVALGLHCRQVSGSYRCAYNPGTRGGPSASTSQSSCLYEDECITQIGIDDHPSNDYQCTSAVGVACDPNVANASCSCRPPEGTWCGPNGTSECPDDDEGTEELSNSYDICSSNLSGQAGALQACNSCYSAKGIWTAVGCISQDPRSMISKIINIGIGILGGIFLLRVLAAGFTLTISQGDVKKTSEAKEMITESIIGVLFVLFSVTILQFIGAGVLKIPGFG